MFNDRVTQHRRSLHHLQITSSIVFCHPNHGTRKSETSQESCRGHQALPTDNTTGLWFFMPRSENQGYKYMSIAGALPN
ncbi:hypothetical protein MBANPS3_011430 [Mucor bainieri]